MEETFENKQEMMQCYALRRKKKHTYNDELKYQWLRVHGNLIGQWTNDFNIFCVDHITNFCMREALKKNPESKIMQIRMDCSFREI